MFIYIPATFFPCHLCLPRFICSHMSMRSYYGLILLVEINLHMKFCTADIGRNKPSMRIFLNAVFFY